MSHCISLVAEPVVGKVWSGKLEENSRNRRNRRHVYFLRVGTAAVRQPFWPSGRGHNEAARAFHVERIYVYRTKWPVPKQAPIAVRMRSAVSTLSCYRTMYLHNRGLRATAWLPPPWLLCAFPTHSIIFKNYESGTSLVVQGLRLWAPSAGGPGSIPGQGARSHTLQLRPRAAK